MKNRHQWSKIAAGGLIAAYLLLTGCLFLMHHSLKATKNSVTEAASWVSGRDEGMTNADSETGADCLEGSGGSMPDKKIALTFDDGPHPVYTPELLDGLKERGIKATFFLMGSEVENYPDVVKRMANEGHLIGNHTFHHVSLENADENMIRTEVISANELIEEVTGQYPQFIRPPFGQCSERIESQTGMICVLWNIDPLDWCTPDASEIVQRVVSNARDHAIILLHDQYKTSVMAAFTIIDELQKEGYEFVTVDEILLD